MEEEEEVVGGVEEGKTSDSDSFSSDPRLCRQSPPTQVFPHLSHSFCSTYLFARQISYLFSTVKYSATSVYEGLFSSDYLAPFPSHQVQSLSEESSGCSTRRRPTALSPSSPRYDSERESVGVEDVISNLSTALVPLRAWRVEREILSERGRWEGEGERLPILMSGYLCQDLEQVCLGGSKKKWRRRRRRGTAVIVIVHWTPDPGAR